jgi:thiol-disulfide isomerase/thioredoxin
MINVTKETFNQEVSTGKVAVKFYRSKGCGNCEKMKPFFEEYETTHPDVKCIEIDADLNKDLTLPTAFRTLPGIFFYENGKFITHTEGVVTVEQMELAYKPLIELKALAFDTLPVVQEYMARAEYGKKYYESILKRIDRDAQIHQECMKECDEKHPEDEVARTECHAYCQHKTIK